MDPNIISSVIVLGFFALMFGVFLGVASKKFAVKEDPRVEKIAEILPGANCGVCGFAGCDGFAKAVVDSKASVNACIPGGSEIANLIGEILGKAVDEKVKNVVVLKCRGGKERAVQKYKYDGIRDCRAGALILDGPIACPNGCIGLGTCEAVCPFDAIHMGLEELPIVDFEKCTGCGVCVEACPKDVLELMPLKNHVWIACNNTQKGALVKSVCQTGCIGCQKCAKECPTQAITIENNLAHIDYKKCTNCQICVVVCPTMTIHTKKSGEVLNDAPKVRETLERKKIKEKEISKEKESRTNNID